ncbi:hypothetical protein ACO0SA_004420 [Hanseniaspora valbyensis]
MAAIRIHRKAYKIICSIILSIVIISVIGLTSVSQSSDVDAATQFKETFNELKNSFLEAGVTDYIKFPGNLVKWGNDKSTTSESTSNEEFIENELENDLSESSSASSAAEYGFDYGDTFKKNVETIWKGLFTPIYYVYSITQGDGEEPKLLYPTKSDAAIEELLNEKEMTNLNSLLDITKDYEKMFKTEQQLKVDPMKACFMSLVRNDDLFSILPTIRKIEDRFNKNYNYSYVFFNDQPFNDEFQKKVKNIINPKSEVHFVHLPKEMWSYPDFIDLEEAAKTRVAMKDIIYGDSESYRHMCRFNSKWFYQHPVMAEFDYYWRIEPDTAIYCDMNHDVFEYMNNNKLVYGFSISLHEYESTIPNLWPATKNFIQQRPHFLNNNNLIKFISDNDGDLFNQCHFWSNFEIVNLNFYRSLQYQLYVEYLDKTGIFFYERAGDAPIHSIAASLFLPQESIKYFDSIAYMHPPYTHCPIDDSVYINNRCDCNQNNDFTFQGYSCGMQYYEATGMTKPKGYENHMK